MAGRASQRRLSGQAAAPLAGLERLQLLPPAAGGVVQQPVAVDVGFVGGGPVGQVDGEVAGGVDDPFGQGVEAVLMGCQVVA